ncbi:MAG: cyclic peptide export ABC transporter [Bacteroidota bacterium]
MKILAGEELVNEYDPGDRGDKSFSIISFALLLYLIGAIGFISWKIHAIAIRKAVFTGWKKLNLLTYLKGLILISPFLMGIYWFPNALAGFDWESILVWMPISFQAMIFALLTAIGISYLAFLINLLFKVEQSYKAKAPFVLLMSIISGLANVIVIILVTSAIDSEIELKYLVFYYALVVGLYLLGRRYVQISLIKIARGIVYDLRLQLTDKIFSTSYENFERIEKGKVYTALNDDVNTLGQSASLIVNLVTSIITTIGAFIFLSLIAFWAAIIVVLLIVALASVYYGVVHSTNTYFEEARDERNRYMRLIGGMIEGFKELIIRRSKKLAFKVDIDKSAEVLKDRMSTADIRFVKAFIVGESLLIVLLGFIAIGMPRMFDNIQNYTVMSFVIVLLYLIGPINGILSAVPAVLQLRIAWNRIKNFVNEIPVVFNQQEVKGNFEVAHFSVERVLYTYKHSEDDKGFAVGPIDFEVRRGEIIFLIGGNGSGKTTFAKLIMGLYRPQEGEIKINGERVKYSLLGEYFSVIFSPPYLFEKLYDIDLEEKKDQLCKYLSLLELDKKVTIHNGRFSTIDLSSGQRKRLALLLCFLEDRPIYLFDEWAADQDPAYRRFFYQTLLPEMKNEGKIIIAITHDDSYFHIADRILKMEEGTLKPLNKEYDLPILE